MLAAEADFRGTAEARVLNAMQADDDGGANADAGNATRLRGTGLFEPIDARAPPPVPYVDDAGVWHELRPDGSVHQLQLTSEQLQAYELLKAAGSKQLRAYIGGAGGTGKSTLIRLCTAYWQSQGLNVLLTATSGKAARLIGGHTVRDAFVHAIHPARATRRLIHTNRNSRICAPPFRIPS